MKATTIVTATLLLTSACSRQDPSSDNRSPPTPQSPPFINTTSIRELMDSMIDPAADGIWDSVATVATLQGVEERQPRTDEEWAAVRSHALALIESPNLLMIEGRHAAPAGTRAGAGELPPEQIEQRIANNRAAFNQLARALSDTARKSLDAIDRKDVTALFATGGDIDKACEACHLTYWYPAVGAALDTGKTVPR